MAFRAMVAALAAVLTLLVVSYVLSYLSLAFSYVNRLSPLATGVTAVSNFVNADVVGVKYFNILLYIVVIALVVAVVYSGFRIVVVER